MVEFENPKDKKESAAEWRARADKIQQAVRDKDPKVGWCIAGVFCKIANFDGEIGGREVRDLVLEARRAGVVPPDFNPGYRVLIKEVNRMNQQAIVTSGRKVRGKEWDFKLNLSNLECMDFAKAPQLKRAVREVAPQVADIDDLFGDAPAPAPALAKNKVAVLKLALWGKSIGAKIPVINETPTHYYIKDDDMPRRAGLPKARENQDYSIEMVESPIAPAPEIELPAAPRRGAPTPAPVAPITKAWQLVETPEAKSRRQDLLKSKETINKIRPIFDAIGKEFQWYNDYDRIVFTSIFFIPNSSLVLKGVPGTGKTQLIEMATLMFANDFKLPGVDLNVYDETGTIPIAKATKNRGFMTQWLLDRGILGSVKHNSDKEIQDVFFFTKINIEKYSMLPDGRALHPAEPEKIVQAPAPVAPVEAMPAPAPSPIPPPAPVEAMPSPAKDSGIFDDNIDEDIFGIRKNPIPIKYIGMTKDRPDTLDVYDISPEPRPIVYSLIKFHNEANRMNSNVADVLLGMMSEQEVEYQGKKFVSPVRWDEITQKLAFQQKADAGSISFFDYNPHLEVENPMMELDRALLDRITAGFYLSGGNTAMRFSVMDKKTKGIKQPRDIIFKRLVEGQIEPVSRAELKEIWKLVNGGWKELSTISIDAEVMAWVAWMTNLPNLPNKVYSGAYSGGLAGKPIDRTLTTFKQALERLDPIVDMSGNIEEEVQIAIGGLARPLGVRSAESLVSLLRASFFLEKVNHLGWKPDDFTIYIKDDASRDKVFDQLCDLLPYVLDHRINLGVGDGIKSTFLSTFDMIKYYFVPKMKEKKPVLYSMMDGLMAVYIENRKREMQNQRKLNDAEKAAMFKEVLMLRLADRAPRLQPSFEVQMTEQSLIFTMADLLAAM